MTSGGARARSGPAPDPNALRRNRPSDKAGWETLPGPREGEAPDWPKTLSRPRIAEKAMWELEWRRPQAWKWEANGQELEVALYVRTFVDAAKSGASHSLRRLVASQQDTLGISLSGLARNRWRIGPAVASDAERRDQAVAKASARGFTVVKGGG